MKRNLRGKGIVEIETLVHTQPTGRVPYKGIQREVCFFSRMNGKEVTSLVNKVGTRKKVVIVGDGATGKTSLLFAYGGKPFIEDHEPTVFENYVVQTKQYGKTVNINFRSYVKMKKNHLVTLCFNRLSFHYGIPQVKKTLTDSGPCLTLTLI